MIRTCLLIFFALVMIEKRCIAQSNTAVNQNSWFMYFGNHTLSKNWSLHTEYQWRRANWITNWQQSLTRVGIDYNLNKSISFTLGYGLITTFPYGEQAVITTFNEHRIWQQLVIRQKINGLDIQHRYRIEQRWSEKFLADQNGTPEYLGFTYGNRIRYRILFSHPIVKLKNDKTIFAACYDEVFINFGPNVKLNIFDQNRLYFAVGYSFSDRGNVQLGYLNQFILKSNGVNRENNHTLQAALTYNFDFTKKPKPTVIVNSYAI